jgi:hypothetical protein
MVDRSGTSNGRLSVSASPVRLNSPAMARRAGIRSPAAALAGVARRSNA